MLHIKKPTKKLAALALIASMLIVPAAVRVYANDAPAPLLPPTLEESVDVETTETATEPVVEETPATPVEETNEEEVVDTPDTTVDADGVTLGEAQIIAQTEHPGSTLKHVKTKVVDGNAVYVFHFEDGWKVYVRAIDGVVVDVKDASEHKHGCKNKLKDDAEFQAWLQNRKDQRRDGHEENNDNEEFDDEDSGRHSWSHN